MADREVLERIAAALERLTPAAQQRTDWRTHPAYVWDGTEFTAVTELQTVGLDRLRGIDAQKSAVLENLKRLANGAAAHDMLLWGARGMGKSALIKACIHHLGENSPMQLALVQVAGSGLALLPKLIDDLASIERNFLLFVDDLAFDASNKQGSLNLRSVVDGGAVARPGNIRIAVTSNRRASVERGLDENQPLSERDERDNALALADRFGLTLAFHPCDQETYLEIVRAYTDPFGITVDPEEACEWAIARGNRSGRTAFQFATELAGRAGLAI